MALSSSARCSSATKSSAIVPGAFRKRNRKRSRFVQSHIQMAHCVWLVSIVLFVRLLVFTLLFISAAVRRDRSRSSVICLLTMASDAAPMSQQHMEAYSRLVLRCLPTTALAKMNRDVTDIKICERWATAIVGKNNPSPTAGEEAFTGRFTVRSRTRMDEREETRPEPERRNNRPIDTTEPSLQGSLARWCREQAVQLFMACFSSPSPPPSDQELEDLLAIRVVSPPDRPLITAENKDGLDWFRPVRDHVLTRMLESGHVGVGSEDWRRHINFQTAPSAHGELSRQPRRQQQAVAGPFPAPHASSHSEESNDGDGDGDGEGEGKSSASQESGGMRTFLLKIAVSMSHTQVTRTF